MADDRGQYVVEIVRDAAGKLADRLHLGLLRDLALEARLLAIVLEAEQHRRLAEPAHAGEAERHRFLGLDAQPHLQVARHLRTDGVAAHRIGDCGLVFRHHEVAGIAGPGAVRDARRPAEGLVVEEQAPVAVRHAEAKGQQRQQCLDIGQAGEAVDAGHRIVDHHQHQQARGVIGTQRHLEDAHRRRLILLMREEDAALGVDAHVAGEIAADEIGVGAAGRAQHEGGIGSAQAAFRADDGAHDAGL